MSPTIGWDESKPADTDSAGLGDDEIRSLKTALRTGLDGEHVWPSGGGDAGVHRYGSARAYYGTQSRVSSSGTDGRLMVTSDTSRIFHVGSTATSFLGGPAVISAGSYPGSVPQRHYWAMEFGKVLTLGASASTDVTIPNSGFSGVPFVLVTNATTEAGGGGAYLRVEDQSNTGFTIVSYQTTGGLFAGIYCDWLSIGTRAL